MSSVTAGPGVPDSQEDENGDCELIVRCNGSVEQECRELKGNVDEVLQGDEIDKVEMCEQERLLKKRKCSEFNVALPELMNKKARTSKRLEEQRD